MSFLGVIGAGVTIAQEVGIGGGNPKDAERKASADSLRDQAIRYGRLDGRGFAAYAKLRCLSGIGRREDEQWLTDHPQYAAQVGGGAGCVGGGWATDTAKNYGRQQVAAVEAAWKVQGAKDVVSTILPGVIADTVDTDVSAAPVGGPMMQAGVFGEIPGWLLLAGVLGVVFLFARK